MALNIEKIYKTYMANEGDEMEFLADYYRNDRSVVAVYNRELTKSVTNEGNFNNTEAMHINFFEDIIQRKIGYMASDITVKSPNDTLNELLKDFIRDTKQVTQNMDSISGASISGLSHRLLYTDDGEVRIKNIPGWQVVYNFTNDIFNPVNAYYFYSVEDLEGKIVYHCDVYSMTDVTYLIKTKTNDNAFVYLPDGSMELNPQPHNFNEVPIFPFINNTDSSGDCTDVINIMNNYDFIISDTADELKATRLTYLKIWGDLYTGQDSEGNDIPLTDWLTRGRAMIFGPDEDGKHTGDAQFLSKTIDDEAVQNMLKLLRTHIYEGAGSVDLQQLTDNADARVFSIQAALSRLENNANVTANYARMALTKQYELLLYWYGESGQGNYDISEVEITFNRNFVKDVEQLVRTLQMAMNVMSTEDAYEQSGLFDDVDAAVLRYEGSNSIIPDGENALDV